MPKKFLLVLLILLGLRNFGQTITEYKPCEVSKDSVYLDEKKFKKSVSVDEFSGLPKNAVDEVKDIYYHRQKKYLDNTKDHDYIIDPKITAYLEATFRSILKSNNIPSSDSFKLHLTRYFIPNAYNTGDWNVFFNIGLLSKMENESQIAFILSHEISHQLLKHSYKHIFAYLKEKYSDDLKKDQKELANTKYGTADKVMELLRKRVYNFTAHSREDEKSADSLGLLLMLKTDFDAREEIRTLQILDSLESDTFVVDFKKHFDGNDFHFKDSWLVKSKTLSFGGKAVYEFDEDSVKTHPDCPKREEYAKAMLSGYNTAGKQKNIQDPDKLKALITNCKFEEVEYMFTTKRYAYCLFHALHLGEEFPNDAYPVNMSVKCLAKIYEASQNHKVQDYIAKPAPNFQENYNALLRLFDRISLSDLNELDLNYAYNNMTKFNPNTTFVNLLKDNHLTHNH